MNYSDQAFSGMTLVDLLRDRVQRQGDLCAYQFLVDGETQVIGFSYAELDRRSRLIAAHLQSFYPPGERVLLLYPPGLEYVAAFFGCLYAGMVAVPAYPPRPNRSLFRLQSMVTDAGAVAALTSSDSLPSLERRWLDAPELASLKWMATDLLDDAPISDWQPPTVNDMTLAFLQYTSGSTAAPKGVKVTHGNLLHNLRGIYQAFGLSAQSHVVSWLPMYHDMGLIGGVLQPLYGGFPVTLMSPLMFLQKPWRWLQAIDNYRATCSGGPNFAYDLCVRKIEPESIAHLDLSCWEVAFNGAEPINAAVIDRFAEVMAPSGFRRTAFYPCYGLAEATLFVSGGSSTDFPKMKTVQSHALEQHRVVAARVTEGDTRTLVSCGWSLPDQQIVIVHPDTLMPCAEGEVGEIWVSGSSVADGYWKNSAVTEELFQARLALDPSPQNTDALRMLADRSFLRTGDLGFLDGGELFVTGRLKDLIILNGANYYPQDLEWTVERAHPAIRANCIAAFSVHLDGAEQLVVAAEVDRSYTKSQEFGGQKTLENRDLDGRELLDVIRRSVSREHDLRVHTAVLLKPGSLPKTSSGKIQRRACRSSFLDGTLFEGSLLTPKPL